jgi:hypothetical protein
LPVIDEILNDTTSAWYLDPASFPEQREVLPVGIFGTEKDDITAVEVLLGFDQFDNITGNPEVTGSVILPVNISIFYAGLRQRLRCVTRPVLKP